jgi:hypothetical protein
MKKISFLLVLILVAGSAFPLTVRDWNGYTFLGLNQREQECLILGWLMAVNMFIDTYGNLDYIEYFYLPGTDVQDAVKALVVFYAIKRNLDIPVYQALIMLSLRQVT